MLVTKLIANQTQNNVPYSVINKQVKIGINQYSDQYSK